jgi:tripartite-type tricarboxylate transporter receptor subunit TctC
MALVVKSVESGIEGASARSRQRSIRMKIAVRMMSVAAAGLFALVGGAAGAQGSAAEAAYPSRPIRIIVPFAAGGAADLMARTVGQKLSATLGQAVVVENRPGAGGNIGADAAAKSSPDGYTLFLVDAAHTSAAGLGRKLSYNLLRDFAPVTLVTVTPLIVVANPVLPVKTVTELQHLAKQRRVPFASGGPGSSTQLAGLLFNVLGHVELEEIPYASVPPAIPDLLQGRVPVMFLPAPVAAPHVASGKLRALAVTTATRSAAWPDLPTVAESGIAGYDASTWSGFMVPAGTPESIIAKLNAEIVKAVASPDVRATLTSQGSSVVGNTRAEFADFLKTAIDKTSQLASRPGSRSTERSTKWHGRHHSGHFNEACCICRSRGDGRADGGQSRAKGVRRRRRRPRAQGSARATIRARRHCRERAQRRRVGLRCCDSDASVIDRG